MHVRELSDVLAACVLCYIYLGPHCSVALHALVTLGYPAHQNVRNPLVDLFNAFHTKSNSISATELQQRKGVTTRPCWELRSDSLRSTA
jgi:hypothetical protein